jgi:malate synthase
MSSTVADIALTGIARNAHTVLTAEALEFLADLHRRFQPRRAELLEQRAIRREDIAQVGRIDFLQSTRSVRDSSWTVRPAPADLVRRRVEITGPTERKMTINALNSGADVWLADFEDSNAPTFDNMIDGQVNLTDAINEDITYVNNDGRTYELQPGDRPAIIVRPRGWHLDESRLLVDGTPIAGGLFDFGLYLLRNAQSLLAKGSGPYFYLPKLESHLEARLWNDVFLYAQDRLGLPAGTIRCTVLVETITAGFEMEEILYELRDHITGLNAGRWDYLFSLIKTFRDDPRFLLPDRNSVTMTAPFMRAYTELLVSTCHRRGAHAIGGMAAFIPNRRDAAVNEVAFTRVRSDKEREAGDGFDGSWVAHPDLVPLCREVFDGVLGSRPNQLDRLRTDVLVTSDDLLDVASTPGQQTAEGLHNAVSVCLQYVDSWLAGNGAVAIFNLMEDAATAEIARSQVWQWVRHGVVLTDGRTVTAELVRELVDAEVTAIRDQRGSSSAADRMDDARTLVLDLILQPEYEEFLTLPASPYLAGSQTELEGAEG